MHFKKISRILTNELKRNYISKLLLSLFILLFANIIYGFSNLNEMESLFPLERFIPLIGLALIMSVLEQELDFNIYEVVKTRESSILLIYVLRTILSIVIYGLFIIGTLYYMDIKDCKINYKDYFLQTLTIGIFLGSIGFGLLGITKNKIYALLGSLSYYLLNWFFNHKKLGNLYLFRLSKNLEPLNELKLILGMVLIVVGVVVYLGRRE